MGYQLALEGEIPPLLTFRQGRALMLRDLTDGREEVVDQAHVSMGQDATRGHPGRIELTECSDRRLPVVTQSQRVASTGEVVLRPTGRQVRARLVQWGVGVVAVALGAVGAPLIWAAYSGDPIAYAHVFGGPEFVLAGVVVMLGGTVELYGKTLRTERQAARLRIFLWCAFASGLGMLGYAARYVSYTESNPTEPSGFILFLCTLIFTISVACGTAAVLLATGW